MKRLALILAIILAPSLAVAGSGYAPPVDASAIGAQPVDATLTAFSGASCVADRVLYCSGADTVTSGTLTAAGRALLDDANAAAQLVTLGAGALCTSDDAAEVPYTPTTGTDWTNPDPADAGDALDTLAARMVAVEAGSACSSYDWADPCYEQAGDGLSIVDVADWDDASTVGGSSSVCIVQVASRFIRVRSTLQGDCSTDYGTTNRAGGIVQAIGAGDFRVAFRFRVPMATWNATPAAALAGPVYVDGADVGTASWYGWAIYTLGTALASADIYQLKNDAGANRWELYDGSYSVVADDTPWPSVDAVMERSGTTLSCYMGPSRGPLYLVGTHTVTAGAGLIGLREQTGGGTTSEMNIELTAFRAGLGAIP